MSSPLAMLDVLVVDGQSTGASPTHGHLLELGWACTHAASTADELVIDTRLLALPEGATIPRAVTRLTGIGPHDLVNAVDPGRAWGELREAAAVGGIARPVVIHYARFELAFLEALHRSVHPDEPLPLTPLWCTHEIARRALPGLPRRGLRALAGYFGHGVDELKRSAEHVRATAFVWRYLIEQLEVEHGVSTAEALEEWLARPPPRREAKRSYPMPRELRLALPDTPGVYRMLRGDGEVLYVGKATSLRKRVNGYFRQHRRVGERTLELLTQARDLRVTPTVTALEAALLETDEIKAHDPPYNVMLRWTGRGPWFTTPEHDSWSASIDPLHRVGPLKSRTLLDAWMRLSSAGPDERPKELERLAWWGEPPDASVWREGWERFEGTWLADGSTLDGRSAIERLGARIWQAWREAEAEPSEDEDTTEDDPVTDAPAWDPARVARALERVVGQGAHELRRARWLCRLCESTVSWERRGGDGRRLLVLEHGAVIGREDLAADAKSPLPPGWARPEGERRACFDSATFDRLRVLTAELRRIVADGRTVELVLSPRTRLAGDRLRRALSWI